MGKASVLPLKDKPLILIIDGELYSINKAQKKAQKKGLTFLTLKATDLTGSKKKTISLDLRVFEILKERAPFL